MTEMANKCLCRLHERSLTLALQQYYLDRTILRGDLVEARSFVEDLSAENRRKLTEDSHSIFIAVRQNMPEIIRFLVEECFADVDKPLELLAQPLDPDKTLEDQETCTLLFYAASKLKTDAALELMRLGADVNAVSTPDGYTALHAACSTGNLPAVRALIQNGADLKITNKFGEAALYWAYESVDVCRFIIENGADVNATDNSGGTVLHHAAQDNKSETVELMVSNGVDIFRKNVYGEDALIVACISSATEALEVMINHLPDDDFKRQTRIRCHQLLGACYLDYENPSNGSNGVEKALAQWEAVVTLREEMSQIIAEEDDVVRKPNTAYDNAVEVDSIAKLDEICQDEVMIYMQGLLLIEKILGPTHNKTIESVLNLSRIFTMHDDYERGLRLLRHGFMLSCDCKLTFPNTQYYTFGLQSVSIHYWVSFLRNKVNIRVNFKDVYEFLETVTLEARHLSPPTPGDKTVSSLNDEENANFMMIVLFLIRLFFLLITNEAQQFEFKKLVNQFIRLNTKTLWGRTFLMIAIYPGDKGEFDLSHLEVDVIKLLLECGADAGETDDNGNSVLHLLEKSVRSNLEATGNVANKETERKVAEMLLAFGAHFDVRNREGLSAVDYLHSLGLNFSNYMTLQCLTAQVIRRHGIPYAGILPKSLIEFVEMH